MFITTTLPDVVQYTSCSDAKPCPTAYTPPARPARNAEITNTWTLNRSTGQPRARERRVVEVERVGEVPPKRLARDALQPVLTAGQGAPLVGHEVDQLRERQRHHREVDPRAAHREHR